MKHFLLFAVAVFATAFASVASADEVTITALDLRSGGVFGHPDGSAANIDTGGGDGIASMDVTYTNLDFDGDGSANDTVTFTVQWTSPDTGMRLFGQGADEGFGDLGETTVSILNVMGSTTDSGDSIVFDGFLGVGTASGSGSSSAPANSNRAIDVNGITSNLDFQGAGNGFVFTQDQIDFGSLASTIVTSNQGVADAGRAGAGSLVLRNYDLQFSSVTAIPEPTSLAVVGLLGSLIAIRRRK